MNILSIIFLEKIYLLADSMCKFPFIWSFLFFFFYLFWFFNVISIYWKFIKKVGISFYIIPCNIGWHLVFFTMISYHWNIISYLSKQIHGLNLFSFWKSNFFLYLYQIIYTWRKGKNYCLWKVSASFILFWKNFGCFGKPLLYDILNLNN